MKQHMILAFLRIFIFLVILKRCFCLDQFYEACVPKQCGDGVNISYPFVIRDLQNSSCGYPGLEIGCTNNGSSVIQLSLNYYSIKEINYSKKTIRLVNTLDITCLSLPTLRKLTPDPSRFRLHNGSNSELSFLMDCSKQLPQNLTRYRINESCYELVMLSNDRNLEIGKKFCTQLIVAPVEVQGGNEVVDGGNYIKVMKRGFIVSWVAPDCSLCEESGGRCGFNRTDFQFRCFCANSNETHLVSCLSPSGNVVVDKGGNRKLLLILATALSAGVATIAVVITLCLIRILKWRRNIKNHDNLENFLKNHEFLAPKRFSYLQLKKMTDSFRVKLGQGGFGSVYRGALSNGNLVAVKILSELKGDGEDFINEVASVGRTCHVNIVSLVGFCFDRHHRALIYEFMPNGSLEKFIYDQASSSNIQLGWEKLHQIAIGIARGLEYLHSGCNTRILHLDIKPHNILLDQDFCPKISDFGLAKLFPEKKSKISMSRMRGTPGYIAPELFSRTFGQVSQKSDVYSYGMMILEMVGGRNNNDVEVDHTSEIYFPHWIYKMVESDEELGLQRGVSDGEDELARTMIIVGLWCIQTNPLSRPTISKVLEMLEGDLTSLEIPPKPYLSSPPRSFASSSLD